MTEEGNVAAPPIETPAAPEAPSAPESAPLIDSEGNLREGWTGILDEDLRDNSFLNESKTLQGMARSAVSARGMVGKDKIVKPTEASSPKDWDDWYTAGGKPQTATDYGLMRPEGLPEEHYSQERADKYMALFHKLGLNKVQADTLFNEYNAEVMDEIKTFTQEKELSGTELRDALRKDWGDAYEQKLHFANSVVESGTGGDEDFKTRLLDKYGNEPDFIRFAANIGLKFKEHGAVDTSEIIPTPSDIQAQIDAAQGNPAYCPDYAKHGFTKAQHRNQVNLVQKLYNKKMVSETKTG